MVDLLLQQGLRSESTAWYDGISIFSILLERGLILLHCLIYEHHLLLSVDQEAHGCISHIPWSIESPMSYVHNRYCTKHGMSKTLVRHLALGHRETVT